MMRRHWVMICIAGTLGACQTASESLPDEALAAKVNGEGIAKSAYEEAVERNLARYRGKGNKLPPGIEQRIRESVLRRLIDDKVVALKASELKLTVSNEALDAKFTEHKARFRTEEAFQDYLRRSNNTEANMKQDLHRNLVRDTVVDHLSGESQVSEKETKEYYATNIKRFMQKAQVRASRILLRVAPKADKAEKNKSRSKGQSLRKKLAKTFSKQKKKLAKGKMASEDPDLLKSLQESFKSAAQEHSNAPDAGRGGALGWLSRGRMPPEFDAVAFELNPGDLSKIIDTRLGHEIVAVWEKKPERQKAFDEVKENIENSLLARKRNQKRREVLKELKTGAQIQQLINFPKPGPMSNPHAASSPKKAQGPKSMREALKTLPKKGPLKKPRAEKHDHSDGRSHDGHQH